MSMSVEQRRAEVIREGEGPWGKLRIAKASSKYDRRIRYLVVEWCPQRFVDTDMEEAAYKVLRDWHPASSFENRAAATAFFAGAREAFRAQVLPVGLLRVAA